MSTPTDLYNQDFYTWAMTTGELMLEDSPSLRREVDALLTTRYRKARERALGQTGLPETVLPRTCPWSSAQILADDFWPETW
jgi:hypothetical protein